MSRRRAKARPLPDRHEDGVGGGGRRRKLPCRVYRCECGAWHLTSVEKGAPVTGPTVSSAGAAAARIHAAATRA